MRVSSGVATQIDAAFHFIGLYFTGTKDSDAIAAAKDVLDRAGIRAERDAGAGVSDGTVLWEQFIQIHRRKVGAANGNAEGDAQ
jgi:hypothetical protein